MEYCVSERDLIICHNLNSKLNKKLVDFKQPLFNSLDK